VEQFRIVSNLTTLVIILATPFDLLCQVTEVSLDWDMVHVWSEEREIPHLIRHAEAIDLQDDAPETHHEAVATGSTMSLHIDQILVCALLVDGSKLRELEGKALWADEGHGRR
jgi:hypothetical protein